MTAAEVIDMFGGPAGLAAEIGAKANTVAWWKRRGRIPAEWWTRVAAAAVRRGARHVTVEALATARAAEVEAA